MIDAIVDLVHDAMSSPWIYPLLFALALIDAFFPTVPSESVVITAGVFAGSTGEPNILLVMAVAAVGAFLGDHISYFIGRTVGGRLLTRLRPGTRKQRAFAWAGRMLDERGGTILVIARYVPGGRTSVTLTAGAVRYPLRSFTFFDAIAAVSWGLYSGMVGYVGGSAFEDNPIRGLIFGLGVAFTVAGLIELIRHRRRRRAMRRGRQADPVAAGDLTADQPATAGQ